MSFTPPLPPPGGDSDPSGYGQPPQYGQPPPYGQPPEYGYGPPPGYGGLGTADHPQGTTILVLGILSLVACGLLGPVAWIMGNNALKEIDARPGLCGNRGNVQAGRVLGMISSILLVLMLVGIALLIAARVGTSTST